MMTVRPSPTQAIDAGLIAFVPADAIATIIVDTTGLLSERPSPIDIGASIVAYASRMGLLAAVPHTESLVLDVFATLPLLAHRPFALVLTDIQARAVGKGGHRLDGMQLGLMFATAVKDDTIALAIQRFLNRYTASETETIQRTQTDGWTIHRLTSRRWPEWVVIEWGPVGKGYLIALGPGAFQRLARAMTGIESGSREDGQLSAAYKTLGGTDATWMWHVDFRRLARALAPTMGTLPGRVLDTLGYADSHARTWAIMSGQRAVRFECIRHHQHGTEHIRLAAPASADEIAGGLIPDKTDTYTLLTWNPREFLTRVRDAYLQTRSPTNQRRGRATWAQTEQELGISIERDLLHQLGHQVVIHADPKHPLGIGLLCTVQISIAGSTRLVRSTIDTLLAKWKRDQQRKNGLMIQKTDDGLWYVQFGIYGPALAVLDRWIVISFSPNAVRHNVARLTGRESEELAERTTP